ncbi:hypothetical protein HanIR_Chr10g0450891 [Helianthus annuus]|nr:hypothetical protein HanIR_Chr10g0450891 [Helianthus annuus]
MIGRRRLFNFLFWCFHFVSCRLLLVFGCFFILIFEAGYKSWLDKSVDSVVLWILVCFESFGQWFCFCYGSILPRSYRALGTVLMWSVHKLRKQNIYSRLTVLTSSFLALNKATGMAMLHRVYPCQYMAADLCVPRLFFCLLFVFRSWMFGSYFGLFVHVVSLLPRYPAVRPKCWVGREAQVLGGQPVSSGFIQHLALLIPWSDQPLSYLVIVPIRKAQIWVKVFKFAGCTKAQTFKSCKFHQWVWACTLAAIDWKAQLRVLHHSAIKAQSIWVSEFVGVRLVYAFCNVVRVLLGKISFLLGWSNLVGFICFLLGRPPKHVLVSCS